MYSDEEMNIDEIQNDFDVQNNEERSAETTETQEQDNEIQTNDQDEENKQVVKPKKVVRNPQPKLNEQTLMGPRGLQALEGYFERVKFKGKGYEEQDLNMLMKTYEYWCHRLFPKYPFDTCIARLESLGNKKALITHKKKIRMGVANEDEDRALVSDDELPPEASNGFVDEVIDPFDQLLPSETQTVNSVTELTEEQREKIQKNKERAEKIRKEKLLKIKKKLSAFLPPTNSQQSEDMFSQFTLNENNIVDVDIDGTNNGCIESSEIVNEISEISSHRKTEHQLPKTNILDSSENQPEFENLIASDQITNNIIEIQNDVADNASNDVDLEELNNINSDKSEEVKDIGKNLETQSDDENEVDLESILDIINVNNTNSDQTLL